MARRTAKLVFREDFLSRLERTGFLLVTGTMLALMAGCSRPAEPGKPAAAQSAGQPAAAATMPQFWKSVTTGKFYRVVVSPSTFQAEWVSVPEEFVKKGASIRSQARREGTKYVGGSESYLPCAAGSKTKERIVNWCHVQTGLEIDFIGPDRILGRGESLKEFDCSKCQALKKEWKDFTWVPAEAKAAPSKPAPPPAH
jgi:hypothetical protein